MKEWRFNLNNIDSFIYFTIPSFEKHKDIKHLFTTRIGGISPKPYNSLNLGFNTNDKKENILKNYKIIAQKMELDLDRLVYSNQVHKDDILIIENNCLEDIEIINNAKKEVDAIITNQKGIGLVTLFADCVPIFILDTKKSIISLAHAGWRGTAKKIGAKVIKKMKEHFRSNPKDCIVGIGPSIGACCYEVDDVVVNKFKKEYKNDYNIFIRHKYDNKYILDLWKANELSLRESGVPKENITISNICTKCNNELLFSHRNEKGITGRMAAIIQIQNKS